MTPKKAYEEALRRIREAEETGAVELDLSGLKEGQLEYSGLERLTRLPPELKRLTSLQSLNLSECGQLSSDLSPLAGLTSLRTLGLAFCVGIRRFAPLESLLPTLKELRLCGCKFDDLPTEVSSPLPVLAEIVSGSWQGLYTPCCGLRISSAYS